MQVDHRLFKVHRHFLERESEVFRWMFLCPPGPEGAEGLTDDKPITLPDITQLEFVTLLDFFYKRYDTTCCHILASMLSLFSVCMSDPHSLQVIGSLYYLSLLGMTWSKFVNTLSGNHVG